MNTWHNQRPTLKIGAARGCRRRSRWLHRLLAALGRLRSSQSSAVPLLSVMISGSVGAILLWRVLGQGPRPLALSSTYFLPHFPARLVQLSLPSHPPGWHPHSTVQLARRSSSLGSGFLPSANCLAAFPVASSASWTLALRLPVLLSAVLVRAFPHRHCMTLRLQFPTLALVAALAKAAVLATAVVPVAEHPSLAGRVLRRRT